MFLGHRPVPLQFRKSRWPNDKTEALVDWTCAGAKGITSRASYVRLPAALPARQTSLTSHIMLLVT